MTSHTRSFVVLLALTLAGCAELGPDPEEELQLGETSSELSVTSWSPRASTGASSDLGAALATVNGVTIMVRTECCDGELEPKDLAWLRRTGPGTWTPSIVIPNQTSMKLISVAGFNNFIYMVSMGYANDLYLSRFDPSTSVWSDRWLLPYQSFAMPAIVAFNNQLRFVGNTPGTNQMWTATMTTGEVFSTATLLPGQYTSLAPVAAAFRNRLYVAHTQLLSANIIYSQFDGTSWTANQFILAGPHGAAITSQEPRLAVVNGYLHLVYQSSGSQLVRWSYFNGCVWSPEVSIGSLLTYRGYSLAQGGPGLVLSTQFGNNARQIWTSEFTAPKPPIVPPTCGVINP